MSDSQSTANANTQAEMRTVRQILREELVIPPAQRPFRWQKQAVNLMKIMVAKFNEAYDPDHEPSQRAYYPPMFLGGIEINLKKGKNRVTDGQQRLSTCDFVALLISERLNGSKPDMGAYLFQEGITGRTLNIKDNKREALMNALIDGEDYKLSDNPSPTEKNLFETFKAMRKEFPADFVGEKLQVFAYWFLDMVTFNVTIHGEDVDEVESFINANSGGAPLTGAEKYVSEMYKNVENEEHVAEMDIVIQNAVTATFNLPHPEFNSFDKFCTSFHQSKHATITGTSDVADFDQQTKAIDEWLKEKGYLAGITTPNSKYKFVTSDILFYSECYVEIVQAMSVYNPKLPHVFAAGKSLPYLPSILLAPINKDDSKEERYKKYNVVAWFMMRFRVFNTWNGDTRTTDKLRTEILVIIKAIRNKSLTDVVKVLTDYANNVKALQSLSVEAPSYIKGGNNKNFTFAGIILTDMVECAAGKPSLLVSYLEGAKIFSTEAEHLAAMTYNFRDKFASLEDFLFYRNQFGGFGFVPKSFNASYGDKDYADKIAKYVEQNTYLGLLNPSYYDENGNLINNKGLVELEKAAGVKFKSYTDFSKELISERNQTARQLFEYFFNLDNLYIIAGLEKESVVEAIIEVDYALETSMAFA